jgi:hypothetical protein
VAGALPGPDVADVLDSPRARAPQEAALTNVLAIALVVAGGGLGAAALLRAYRVLRVRD